MTTTRITHIGGPTALIEMDGWRLLTDPTFDPPGRRYTFGWGSSSRKLTGPAVAATDLGPIDVVQLSHDHHGDNLDDTGRALLPATPCCTTASARSPTASSTRAGPTSAKDALPSSANSSTPADIGRRLQWLPIGASTTIAG
jgi:hypothetical protein